MTPLELRKVHEHLSGLEAVLAKSQGGWGDKESLGEFRRLCREARALTRDRGFHEQVDLLLQFAKDLYSDHRHHRWDIGPVFGADILRRKIRMALRACGTRLPGSKAAQSVSARAPGLPALRLRRVPRASPT